MQAYNARQKNELREKLPQFLFYAGIGITAAILIFRYLWKPILPFLLAFFLAILLQKPLDFLDRLCGHKSYMRKIIAFVFVFGCAGILLLMVIGVVNALIHECGTFLAWLGEHLGEIGEALSGWTARLEHLLSALPFLDGVRENNAAGADQPTNFVFAVLSSADQLFMDMVRSTLSSVTSEIPSVLTAAAAALPKIILFFGVFLVAALYLTLEYRNIGNFLQNTFPEKTAVLLRGLKSSLVSTVLHYLKAYVLLGLLTFAELYAGFCILGIDWAFGAAVLGTLIDLLPVVGTGTLLMPWAAIELFRGAWFRGIGLIVLYIIICVIRQILEPKLIGKTIGLHPLAALFCMYLGLKLFGVAGLFFVPMTVGVIWNDMTARRHREEKNG